MTNDLAYYISGSDHESGKSMDEDLTYPKLNIALHSDFMKNRENIRNVYQLDSNNILHIIGTVEMGIKDSEGEFFYRWIKQVPFPSELIPWTKNITEGDRNFMNTISTPFDFPFLFLFEDVSKEDVEKAKQAWLQAKKDLKKRFHMQHVSDSAMFSKEDNEWYNKFSALDISNKLWRAENTYHKLQDEYSTQVGAEAIKKREESLKKLKDSTLKKKDEIKNKVVGLYTSAKSKAKLPVAQEDVGISFELAESLLAMENVYDTLLILENHGYDFGEDKELLFSLVEKSLFELGEGFIIAESVENVSSNLYMEAALTSKERKALDDSEFGLPEDRAYPLIDEIHVSKAITFFNKCDKSKQKELARNIIKAMKKFDMINSVKVSEKNDFYKYYKNREKFIKENFDIRPFPAKGVVTEFSVGAMLPQIPLTGSYISKSSNVTLYDDIEVRGELSEDPRLIGSFTAEESVLNNLLGDLSMFSESVVEDMGKKVSSVLATVKQKFEELIKMLKEKLEQFLSNNSNTDEELEELNRRYPTVLKQHPELANIDLSDHFHDTSLSVRDTANYERETKALIEKYMNSNMTDDKFNSEFDKIRKKFIKERKQIFTYNVKNPGEPTGKIILKGVMNLLPTIIKVAGAAILIKEAHNFAEEIAKKVESKLDSSGIKTAVAATGDIGKKAVNAVKTVTTASKDIISEATDRERVKKKFAKEIKTVNGMKKFYGDMGKSIAKKVTSKSYKKESEDIVSDEIDLVVTESIIHQRKKNATYSEELKKIATALKGSLANGELPIDKVISKGMNFKNTVCTFALKPSQEGKENPKIISKIKSLGFKESDDEGIKSVYEKEVKNVLIILTYDEVMDKIKVVYEEKKTVEEFALCDYVYEAGDIDGDIKDILNSLHAKGYKTKYSCAGHTQTRIKEDGYRDGIYKGKLYSTARIIFSGNYDISAPDDWSKKTLDDDKTAIYVKPVTYNPKNGTPDNAFDKWKNEYMASLKSWVDNLPKVSQTVTESAVEDAENYIFDDVF